MVVAISTRTHGARFPVAPEGEVCGAPGVVVADGSLCLSSTGVPPQVGIMTLATVAERSPAARRS